MVAGERVLVGLVGASLVLFLIQGLQRGVMVGEFTDYDAEDQPLRFALAVVVNVISIALCAVFACGYDLNDVWQLAKVITRHA